METCDRRSTTRLLWKQGKVADGVNTTPTQAGGTVVQKLSKMNEESITSRLTAIKHENGDYVVTTESMNINADVYLGYQ